MTIKRNRNNNRRVIKKLISVPFMAINYPAFLNKRTLQIKKCQRRFYRISFISLGKGDKFFKVGKVYSNPLLNYLKKNVLIKLNYKQNKIIGHKSNDIDGNFVDKKNKIYIGFNTYTSKDLYNAKVNNQDDTLFSTQIDKNYNLSQEMLLIQKKDLDNNKMIEDINDFNNKQAFIEKIENNIESNNKYIDKNVVETYTLKIMETTNVEKTRWEKTLTKSGNFVYREIENDNNFESPRID